VGHTIKKTLQVGSKENSLFVYKNFEENSLLRNKFSNVSLKQWTTQSYFLELICYYLKFNYKYNKILCIILYK